MSTVLLLHLLQHAPQRGSEKLLLLAIASFAHDDGTGASPSIATLARLINASERNVQYLLRKLEADGALRCEIGTGPYGCNRYTIIVDQTIAADPPAGAPVAPSVQSTALAAQPSAGQSDELRCTRSWKDGSTEGRRARADAKDGPAAPSAAEPMRTPPGEPPLTADPFALWHAARARCHPLDDAQLRLLAAEADRATGSYGCYWLGRAILAASLTDPHLASNPRALHLVRAILRRWQRAHAFGSDTPAYTSASQERCHVTPRSSLQQLAVPRRPDHGIHAKRSDLTGHAAAPTISSPAAYTIIGLEPDGGCDASMSAVRPDAVDHRRVVEGAGGLPVATL
jgi:hypothetical protein